MQYASFASGLQVGEFYVRLEAPAADCHAIAEALFAKHAKEDPHDYPPKFLPISHPARVDGTHVHPAWFDIDQISHGVLATYGEGYAVRIWIDEDHGIFYRRTAQ